MFIDGFALAGYRSFGKVQHVAPCGKVNLLIGPNNSGKSNVLSFLRRFVRLSNAAGDGNLNQDEPWNDKLDSNDEPFTFGWGLARESSTIRGFLSPLGRGVRKETGTAIMNAATGPGECIWAYRYRNESQGRLESPITHGDRVVKASSVEHHDLDSLFRKLGLRPAGSPAEQADRILGKWGPFSKAPVMHVETVPAFRQVGDPTSKPTDYSGVGLIERLAELQEPDYDQLELKEDFNRIVSFLREVTGRDNATIHVPSNRKRINIEMDGRHLPLENLGTGIHEVVIIATAATLAKDAVVCIEEPEIHLHPILQRKLVRYLSEQTTNQYFIATHSVHLIDAQATTVFRVELADDGMSRIRCLATSSDQWDLCRDLGYRASDIMQANCVVWVEGPSDRIYLNHWIQAKAPRFIEGLHYQIMFYGGRLLSHLSADDPEVTKFISLCGINRNVAVVMDRDRDNRKQHINKTKKRIQQELDEKGGLTWVTDGREMENYIPAELLCECVDAIQGGYGERIDTSDFANSLKIEVADAYVLIDKVKVAHAVAARPADLSRLELGQRIDELVKFIDAANH